MSFPTVTAGPAGGGAYVVHARDGLSPRGRVLAWTLALALVLVGAGALYGAAAAPLTGTAAPQTASVPRQVGVVDTAVKPAADAADAADAAEEADAVRDTVAGAGATGIIQGQWDGPTIHVDWRGNGYRTVSASFVADRVISPGDDVDRTLTLANDGPGAAVLSVAITVDQALPEAARNPELGRDVVLFWDVAGVEGSETFARLLERDDRALLPVAEAHVARGATVPVTVGFRFATDVTDHRMLAAESTMLRFDVLATLRGDTAAPPALAKTGAAVLGWAALAGGLVVAGWLLIAARRRRRCDDCGRHLGGGDEWSEHHVDGGRAHVRCGRCLTVLGECGATPVSGSRALC